MRSADYIGAAALILLVSATGMAQTSATSNGPGARAGHGRRDHPNALDDGGIHRRESGLGMQAT